MNSTLNTSQETKSFLGPGSDAKGPDILNNVGYNFNFNKVNENYLESFDKDITKTKGDINEVPSHSLNNTFAEDDYDENDVMEIDEKVLDETDIEDKTEINIGPHVAWNSKEKCSTESCSDLFNVNNFKTESTVIMKHIRNKKKSVREDDVYIISVK